MSTAIFPIHSQHSAPLSPVPLLPERRVTNVDCLHTLDQPPTTIVVFCQPQGADIDALVAELRERGCLVTGVNLNDASECESRGVVRELSSAIRWRTKSGTQLTAVAIVSPQPNRAAENQRIEYGGLVIDRRRHEVLVRGRAVEFSRTELDLLFLLASYPGIVLSRRELVEACKGEAYPSTDRSIDVQIVGIRRKLGPVRHYLQTVRGVGYRFEGEVEDNARRIPFPK
jgi:DNA-binding winged helix-turn-helix (wHTH) protein